MKNTILIALLLFSTSTYAMQHKKIINPYENVVWVTNSIDWPYNTKTYGHDSFRLGDKENEDTKLLNAITKNGFHFPDKFEFGVACSAYQYEGNRVAPNPQLPYGIGWSIWDMFSKKGSWLNPKGTNIAALPPTDRYTHASGKNAIKGFFPEYYDQDLQLIKKAGVDFYRLSISWPRLFPHPGMSQPDPDGVKYYITILDKLKKAHIKVLITLYHWDLPAWLYNFGDASVKQADKTYGWLDMREAKDNLTLQEFQKYVAASYHLFGSYTPYFSTFNEPLTFTNSAFTEGVHAPGQNGWKILQKVSSSLYGKNFTDYLQRVPYLQAINIIKAHYIAYKTIHQMYANNPSSFHDEPQVSIVLNSDWAEPYRIECSKENSCRYNKKDIQAAQNNMDFMLGWWLHPVMFGNWPANMQSIYNQRIQTAGLQEQRESSCLRADGRPTACDKKATIKLADYIATGGALDMIGLNHYTGYFVADMGYAKSHISKTIANQAIPPDQYGNTPDKLKSGWYQDQHNFMTQFRYRKQGDTGAIPGKNKIYIIGNSGNKPWLRQTWFVYRKLLQYINYYYLSSTNETYPQTTKMGKPFSALGIYLTENGTSIYHESQKNNLQDKNRIQYILGNLAAVQQAINLDSINVKLYTYWSFADNFEWSEGYDSRFGLVRIDYQHNFKRDPKQSFFCYQEIIANKKTGKFPQNCQ
jgi:beta-glucosidase/6-phospho-beta-glucosidase/beta-galactosidase